MMSAACAGVPEYFTGNIIAHVLESPIVPRVSASILTMLGITIAATVVLSCLRTVDPPDTPPITIDVAETGTPYQDPYLEPSPPLCVRHDKIVLRFDGGSVEFNTPRPCVPMWRYRELGDPPDVHR